jgi:twitching motility protein PilT
MAKLIRDPNLDDLVRSLNEGGDAPQPRESAEPSLTVASTAVACETLLIEMIQRGASDLLLLVGTPPVFRIGGRLVKSERAPLSGDDLHELMGAFAAGRIRQKLESEGSADFSIRLSRPANEDDRRAMRFRVNLHRQRGTLAAAIRALPSEIPTLAQLNLPQSLAELVKPTRGLVLICGPTGSGKTTTLAALVAELNRNDGRHVITIEDPVEYEHRNGQSIIEQVEIGRDAPSFAAALRAALRQDPDVILVGEMRDLETVSTALTAAETGHLILATLHTSDVAQAIHRVVDVFPPAQQTQVRHQLSAALNAIVVQHLMPRSDAKGRCVAVEVLLANQAVRNHIRTDKLQNLPSELTLGRKQGMISLEDSLAKLVQQGFITREDAQARATHRDELDAYLR